MESIKSKKKNTTNQKINQFIDKDLNHQIQLWIDLFESRKILSMYHWCHPICLLLSPFSLYFFFFCNNVIFLPLFLTNPIDRWSMLKLHCHVFKKILLIGRPCWKFLQRSKLKLKLCPFPNKSKTDADWSHLWLRLLPATQGSGVGLIYE